MLLIHDHKPEIMMRQENRRARTEYDVRTSPDGICDLQPSRRCLLRMKNQQQIPEDTPEPFLHLTADRNFRN